MKSKSLSPILDAQGQPMVKMGSRPYIAADTFTQELATWNPLLGSADGDYNFDRDTIVARTRDMARNSGWAASAVSKHLDNVIGSGFRLSSKPDYQALGQSPDWAVEFARQVESGWRLYSEDPDFYMDAARQDNFAGLLGLGFRHKIQDGDALAAVLWSDDKPFNKYATTIQILDPDRLSNPHNGFDTPALRAGVERNMFGAPIAYHIRKAHPYDFYTNGASYEWERVERETAWGRRQIIHAYDKDRAEQSRGVSIMAPVLERFKMVDKYDRVELQAALLNATFAAFIESPFDHELLADALDGSSTSFNAYQDQRSKFHDKRAISMQGVRIPTLFPGEKFNFQQATRPAYQFGEFEKACLRNIAAGCGLSYEQLTQDWTSTNYSSARAALMEVWKFMLRGRQSFADQFATPIFILWLEEAISRGDIILPKGAPDFYEGKAAYSRCRWIGPGRGWIDPVKEAQAAQMRMDMGISTLEDECAEQGGDWEEKLYQRARELKMCKELGLPPPAWAAQPIMYAVPSDQTGQ